MPGLLRTCLALLLACGCASPDESGSPSDPNDTGGAADGERIYASQCAGCHGDVGEGGVGPRLSDIGIAEPQLAAFIAEYMPPTRPESCDAACARAVARYILTELTTAALACDAVEPSARRLRLLTRREYRRTIFTLFPSLDPAVSSVPAEGGSSCRLRRFEHHVSGRRLRSVHLAGSFNDWSATAWPLALDSTTGIWWLEREIPEGRHEYKLVLDGSEWVTDTSNPNRAPDGFGGDNSVLTVSCGVPAVPPAPAMALGDPASGFPVETRPDGFPFDDDSDSARVTAVHVDEQLSAAMRIARALGDGVLTLVPCTGGEQSCTESFVRTFGRRVFRRPLTDSEVERYVALSSTSETRALRWRLVVQAMLVSPHLLYRSEVGVPQPDGTARLSGFEMAAALSYTMWGTTPDDALLDAAERGELEDASGVEREARRLLADPRSRGPIRDFAVQWLGVESLATSAKSPAAFPDFGDELRRAMLDETARLVEHAVFDSTGRFDEILTADYTFATAALARHYGIDPVAGSDDSPARVSLEGTARAGVLGHGSVLGRYAHSDQSSPIQRGLFVRRNLLCQTFGQPPANAGGVPDVDPAATTRERFRQHTQNEACASCHRYIDPVGFGFEGFDAVGRARTIENAMPIDSRGDMNDVEGFGTGTSAPFDSLPQLGATLASSESASACFVRQWFRFSRGYRESVRDRCALDRLEAFFREHDGDVRELMVAVVSSPDFRSRR